MKKCLFCVVTSLFWCICFFSSCAVAAPGKPALNVVTPTPGVVGEPVPYIEYIFDVPVEVRNFPPEIRFAKVNCEVSAIGGPYSPIVRSSQLIPFAGELIRTVRVHVSVPSNISEYVYYRCEMTFFGENSNEIASSKYGGIFEHIEEAGVPQVYTSFGTLPQS